MNKLYTLIPHDKALHAIVCAAIAVPAAHLAPQFGLLPWVGALAVSASVGVGYEAWQWWRKTGHVSGADVVAGVAGGAVVALATLA
jgi:hypothetical protein